MTVLTVQTVKKTVHRNYCVNPPAFWLWKVETRIRILVKTHTFCSSFSFPFLFFSLLHQSFVYTNNTHATFWNEKNRAKMAILGSKAIFRPYCDLWTVSSTVPSCTVWTVTIFRNDGLTPSFTASTVRPYFDGPYRQPSLHSPDTKPVLNSVLILYWTAYWILNLY